MLQVALAVAVAAAAASHSPARANRSSVLFCSDPLGNPKRTRACSLSFCLVSGGARGASTMAAAGGSGRRRGVGCGAWQRGALPILLLRLRQGKQDRGGVATGRVGEGGMPCSHVILTDVVPATA